MVSTFPRWGSWATPSSSSGRKPHSKRREETRGMARRERGLAIPSWLVESKPHGDFMNMERQQDIVTTPADTGALASSVPPSPLVPVPEKARGLLLRMFADPYVLEPSDRAELIGQLRESVCAHPEVAELRVLLGMALCVNLEVQEALEELREGVKLAPDSFICQLKMGELWMRLRVCRKAEEHTRRLPEPAGCAEPLAPVLAASTGRIPGPRRYLVRGPAGVARAQSAFACQLLQLVAEQPHSLVVALAQFLPDALVAIPAVFPVGFQALVLRVER